MVHQCDACEIVSLMLEHLPSIRGEIITKTENNSRSVPEYC